MPGAPLHTLDNLPYRCPKCGDTPSFPSLRSLRQHLEIEHHEGNPIVKKYDIYGNRYKKDDGPEKISPLFNSYGKQSKELEERLAIAKETERFHRDQWNKFKYTLGNNPSLPGQNGVGISTFHSERSPRSHRDTGVLGQSPRADMFQLGNGTTGNPYLGQSANDKENTRIEPGTGGPVSSRSDNSLWTYTNKEMVDLRYKVDRMKEQLQFKDSQLKKFTEELMKLTEERVKRQRELLDMSKQQDESTSRIAYFEGKIEEKDRLIEEKQHEIMSLSMFLHDLSIKETAAKQCLEDYVGSLLDRTEKAESKLKRRESQASSHRSQSFKEMSQQQQDTLLPDDQDLRSTWDQLSSNYMDAMEVPTINEPSYTSTPQSKVEHSSALKIPAPVSPKRGLFPPQFHRSAGAAVVSPSGMSSYSVGEVIDLSSLSDKLGKLEVREALQRNRLTSSLPPSKPKPEVSLGNTPPKPQSARHTDQPVSTVVAQPDGTVHEYSPVWPSTKVQDDESPYYNVLKKPEHYNLPAQHRESQVKGQRFAAGMSSDRRYTQSSEESEDDSDTLDEDDSQHRTQEEETRPCSVGEVHLSSRPRRHEHYSSKRANDWKNTSLKAQRRREGLYCVFIYLDTKTLARVGLVCKEWRDVSRDPSLWRHVIIANAKISSKYLCTLASWCTQLQVLQLADLRPRSIRKKESNSDYERSIRGCLELGLEALLKVSGNSLISLKVLDCGEIITDRCLWLAGCHSPYLERLAYISETDPAGVESVYALGAGCRNISTLLLQPSFPNQKPHRFNNKTVHRIGQCWPHLRVVCIGGVDVDIKGLGCLAKHCQHLHVLELDHMREIGEETAAAMCKEGLKNLHTLDFTFTPVTPKALLVFSNACPKLKDITVNIGISDYYEDIINPLHRENYEEIVYKLKSLRTKPILKGRLHIQSDHG